MKKTFKAAMKRVLGKKELITPFQKIKMAKAGDTSFLNISQSKQWYAAGLKAYPGSQIHCPFCGDLFQKICYDGIFHHRACELFYNEYVEKIFLKEKINEKTED